MQDVCYGVQFILPWPPIPEADFHFRITKFKTLFLKTKSSEFCNPVIFQISESEIQTYSLHLKSSSKKTFHQQLIVTTSPSFTTTIKHNQPSTHNCYRHHTTPPHFPHALHFTFQNIYITFVRVNVSFQNDQFEKFKMYGGAHYQQINKPRTNLVFLKLWGAGSNRQVWILGERPVAWSILEML